MLLITLNRQNQEGCPNFRNFGTNYKELMVRMVITLKKLKTLREFIRIVNASQKISHGNLRQLTISCKLLLQLKFNVS